MSSLRSNALKLYLLGTLGQIALVCLVVFFLRQSGTTGIALMFQVLFLGLYM